MELKQLTKVIDYHWKIQSFSKYYPEAQCVAYIDARDVMNILDEVVGPDKWQDRYEMVGDKFVAGIGININDKGGDQWVWKFDTGTSGDFEVEKSAFSDAFKRAAVKWGVGRFLYDLEFITVKTNAKKEQGVYPYVIDQAGKRVNDLTEFITSLQKTPTSSPVAPKAIEELPKPPVAGQCPECHSPLGKPHATNCTRGK